MGHTIDGLSIHRPGESHVGLFGYALNATLRNVGVVGGRIQGAESVGGLVGFQVRHHDGDDLRMLVAHQVGHRTRVHPLQCIQAGGVAAQQDAVDQVAGLFAAQRLHQHVADVVVRAHAQRGLRAQLTAELVHHPFYLFAGDVGHGGHGDADLLHLLRFHVAQHFGRVQFTQRQQQDGGALHAGQGGDLSHWPPSP
ncbi:hypothetical protein D3C73_1265760 [compost metagenome]